MTIRRIFRAVAAPSLAAALALFATACSGGGGGTNDSGNGAGKKADAAFEYRKCMRENGIDVPEPKSGGGDTLTVTGDAKSAQKKMDKALKACASKAKAAGIGKEGMTQHDRDKLLAYAKCMREHGIDMPDPNPGEVQDIPNLQGAEKLKFEKADKACQGAGR